MKATTLTQSSLMTDPEFTDDGGIILPDDPVGEHIVVTVSLLSPR